MPNTQEISANAPSRLPHTCPHTARKGQKRVRVETLGGKKLMNVLQQDEPVTIPEWQKQEVRKRIKKYDKNPKLLIDEKEALKIINQM